MWELHLRRFLYLSTFLYIVRKTIGVVIAKRENHRKLEEFTDFVECVQHFKTYIATRQEGKVAQCLKNAMFENYVRENQYFQEAAWTHAVKFSNLCIMRHLYPLTSGLTKFNTRHMWRGVGEYTDSEFLRLYDVEFRRLQGDCPFGAFLHETMDFL